jgi:hypothetical protein
MSFKKLMIIAVSGPPQVRWPLKREGMGWASARFGSLRRASTIAREARH